MCPGCQQTVNSQEVTTKYLDDPAVYLLASVPPPVSNLLILHKVIMTFQVRCKILRGYNSVKRL